MEYTKAINDFLFNTAKLNENEMSVLKYDIDKIVLFKNREGSVLHVLHKIIQAGHYDKLIELVEFHSDRPKQDPITEIEAQEAGVH